MRNLLLATTALAFALPVLPAFADAAASPQTTPGESAAVSGNTTTVIISARRRNENVQDVPVAVSVLSGTQLEATGTYSIEQVTKLQPSLQFLSQNPRNTAVTIRGLGSNIGLTNDGLESGVGIYVDEVYYARPGSAVVDLLDINRVEVLRGPQGTLFGKNTTAGALNLVTNAPTFTPEGNVEVTGGNYGFVQAKAVLSGALTDKIAGRIALGSTRRDGWFYNTTTKTHQQDVNSQAARVQLLIRATQDVDVKLSYDYAYQDPEANTQVFVRYGATQRPANTQFPFLAGLFNYAPASTNPYDRLVDVNSPLQARQILQGGSARVDWDLGDVTFSSISAVRAWDWTPQNDRDYTALSIRTKSNNPSAQNQWSQEFRLSSDGDSNFKWVAGIYAFGQEVQTNGVEEWGSDAALWLIGSSVPGNLLTGYRADTDVHSETTSYAAFGQVTWDVTPRLHLTGGLRYTYEEKSAKFAQTVSGGLATLDATLISRKNGIARNQTYQAAFVDQSPTGLLSVAYDFSDDILGYVTLARGYKSGGINAAGIPTDAAGNPSLVSAVIKPEDTSNLELGLKTQFFDRTVTANFAAYATDIDDYQANVVDNGPGSLRGYLANVEKVTVRGFEVDTAWRPSAWFTGYATLSWTDAKYDSFRNGPPPLEFLTATTAAYDLSGKRLPGVSEWSGSVGGEWRKSAKLSSANGEVFGSFDLSYRSDWYSDASVSKYALIEGSTLLNLRTGFRGDGGTDVTFWVKNALDEEYLAFTTVQAGNSGAIYGQPGDPRTYGVTVRKAF
ncbi:TonB-dependent receptor [Asticcacaulis sp. AC402]|uniref:TonB-dependent receptor n=1 Tax=Asticcacaulis sp. AC402 TaxID=1282361 RepID=UPI0003C3E048|nr:TonB-dependent receptor [Asticcacaulis sp. AC402]ESQ75625.1 hypothetical protein ABAC402_08860 [Asticcacaulis sp. AC402]